MEEVKRRMELFAKENGLISSVITKDDLITIHDLMNKSKA